MTLKELLQTTPWQGIAITLFTAYPQVCPQGDCPPDIIHSQGTLTTMARWWSSSPKTPAFDALTILSGTQHIVQLKDE